MKPPSKTNLPAAFVWGGLALLVLALAWGGFLVWHGPEAPNQPPLTTSSPHPAATNLANTPSGTPMARPIPSGFQEHPFPVGYESTNSQWTTADGKDTNIIRQLAHNPLEYARMVEENPRIFRRQLVYLKKTAAAVLEDAKLTGTPVKQLTLPGLDGRELQFEITQDDSQGSSRQGMMSGHLAGNPNSRVTFAFQDGREAYTVLSPDDYIYLVGEPREPGQIIVKAIDPNTYGVGPAEAGDDFIKTGQPVGK